MSSIFNGERIVSSKDDVGTRGFSHVKKMMMITKSQHMKKITQYDKKPKYRVKTTKFLGGNLEVNLHECEFGKAFLAMTSKYEEKNFQKINYTI